MKNFPVHPISEKLIKEGHPWITLDRFSAQFPKKHELIELVDKNKKKLCVAINDPEHPQIKARVWNIDLRQSTSFEEELKLRLENSLKKRKDQLLGSERDNFYWFFGEADSLPGLFGIQLKNILLLQLYSTFWGKYIPLLKSWVQNQNKEIEVWIQERSSNQPFPHRLTEKKSEHTFSLQEFDVNYEIKLGDSYDFGIYTDMSSIRKKMSTYMPINGSLLNLYCYTGAWSLFALKNKVSQVTSIDLSPTYIEWLEKNLTLNHWEHYQKHHSIINSVDNAIETLKKQGITYDFIVCDPPSASSDGKKITNALKNYEELLPKLSALLNKKGKALIFLNTHSVTAHKFKTTMSQIIEKNNLGLSLMSMIGTHEDCPTLKSFPEGSYLKGLLYQKG